jgi:outer membrane protein assembly factor BamD
MDRRAPVNLRLLAVLLLVAGCKTASQEGAGEPDYASDADTNLQRGTEALGGKNYLEAERYFEYVKTKYPFLEAAKEAELKLADTDFERERFLEARDRYQNFIKLHPTHPKVDYAAYRAALTHYKEIPSDFFLLPPSKEKDQVEVRGTLSAMNDFVRQYPNSEYVAEAKKLVDEARKRLADHEVYVAEFYAKREKWPAVINRYKKVLEDFSGLGYDEQAYFGIYDAYLQLKDTPRAVETLRSIVAKMPGTSAAERAQKLLARVATPPTGG